jgi:hypothetical protein
MRKKTVAAADAMKEAGVTIVGVGIAIEKQTDSDFLEGLASSPALYSSVPTFDELDQYLDVIMEHVCGVCVRRASRARVLAPSSVPKKSIWLQVPPKVFQFGCRHFTEQVYDRTHLPNSAYRNRFENDRML